MMNQNDSTSPGGANANNVNGNLLSSQIAQLLASGGASLGGPSAAPAPAPVDASAAAVGNEAQALLSILQQRQQQSQSQRPSFVDAAAVARMDRESNEQAQALLKHHEERLRATRLLLEQQEHQGNLQQHPLLMASNAMAAARAAQNSVLGGLGVGAATNAANAGGALVFPATAAANASGSSTTGHDEKMARMIAAQERLTADGQIGEEDLAAVANQQQAPAGEEADLKRPAESDEEKEVPEHDDDEGYDDKMTDDEYFENFSASDDNRVIQETFPLKLYRMLHEVEKSGKQNIVSFLPHGKSFVVHKPKAFVEEVMPKYFTTCRLASFQRQLNLYGFRRITEGREKGAYSHDFFLKGKRALCRKVKRQKTRVKATQHHSFGSLAALAAPTQPFLGLGAGTSFSGALAAASAPNLGSLLQSHTAAHGLTNPALALLGRLSGNSVPPARVVGGSDAGYNILQEALRRGLLTDVNSARQQGTTAAANTLSLATQELQKKLQEQEAELIIQRLQQQQQNAPTQPPNQQNRR